MDDWSFHKALKSYLYDKYFAFTSCTLSSFSHKLECRIYLNTTGNDDTIISCS